MTVIIPNFDVVVDGTEGEDYVLTKNGTTWTGQPFPATRYPLPSIPVRIVSTDNNYNFSKGDWGRFIRFTSTTGKLVLPDAGPGTPNPNWPIGVQALIQNACVTNLTISPATGAQMRSRAGNNNPLVSTPGGQQIHVILIAAGIWAVSEHAVGAQGPVGPPGAQGATGPQGAPGAQGVAGPQGAPGIGITYKGTVANAAALPSSGNTLGDAYITLDNNHTNIWSGTAWDDVGTTQGPQGIQGIQGPQGIQGTQGVQGATGATGIQGPQGEIGDTGPEGPRGVQGEEGPAGPQGIQGPAGPQGLPSIVGVFKGTVANSGSLPGSGNTLGDTYLVTSNNHLWIWDGTAWLDAGAAGLQGPQGPQGAQGPTGARGPAGATGQGVPAGGTTGQALVKTSNSNYATAWRTIPGTSQVNADWNATSGVARILNKPTIPASRAFSSSSATGLYLLTLASGGGSLQLEAGDNISLTTTGTATDAIVRIASTGGGGGGAIAVQDEGTPLTSSATTLNFTGGGVTASAVGGVVTVAVGSGTTDLGYTASTRVLTSSTGTDVTLPLVGAEPGLMSAADKTSLDDCASARIPTGGTLGQVLTKTSATDYADAWQDPALPSRTIVLNTASLAAGAIGTVTFDTGKVAAILNVAADNDCWVLFYGDAASATTDTRSQPFVGTPPNTGSGYFAEFLLATPVLSIRSAPVPIIQCPSNAGVIKVQNRSGATRAIQVTIVYARISN